MDDHEVVLRGLTDFFASQPDIDVQGQATSGQEALATLDRDQPDVALLDRRLPDMDGVALCREIKERFPEVRCVMLSSFAEDAAVIEALIGGAAAYISKETPLSTVADLVRRVAQGEPVMDPAVVARAFSKMRGDSTERRLESLTTQEQKIIDLIAAGMSNREIAEEMHLAEQTVKNYVSNLLAKLGLQRRTQAARLAADRGGWNQGTGTGQGPSAPG